MKKLLFSTAVAVALGVSNLAYAAVDLNDSDPVSNGSLTYASEIDVSPKATLSDSATDIQDLQAELGFSVNANATRFVRVDLGAGATFTAAPLMAVSSTGTTGTISDGGTGKSFVIFEFTAGQNFGPTDPVVIDVNGIDVVATANVSARYRLFETGTAASNNGTALEDTSQTAYRFSKALSAAAEDADEEKIDVATNSTKFEGDAGGTETSTPIGQVQINIVTVPSTPLWTDSAPTTNADVVAAGTSIVVTGDFSAVPLGSNGNPDPAKVTLNGAAADSLTTSTATFTTSVGATMFPDTTEAKLVMNVTGDVVIPEGSFTGVYDVTPASGAATGDVNLGTLSTLVKNGSTVTANMVLAPLSEGGAFRNFIRISNNSGIAGRVFLRVRNDLGDSVTFDLGEVQGQASTILDANSATSLISNDQLFAAAQTKDPTFELGTGGRNKLRLTVEAEVPAGGLTLENISLANDNTTFSTFQSVN